ncbi:LOW QUALITY PROTEIN: hypothetical protein YC2023_070939 [Brassica napus]
MSEKVNPWFPPVPASVLLPPATAGSSAPPPDPPDPPDPLSPSSPSFDFQFPTLQTTVASPPLSKKQISLLKGTASFGSGNGKSSLLLCSSSGPAPEKVKESLFHTRSADFKSTLDVTVHNSFTGFTVLPPKNSSNYPSNYTPSKSNHSPGHNPTIKLPQLNPNPSTSKPNQSSSSQPATPSPKPASPPISYAEKAKPIADKTLRRTNMPAQQKPDTQMTDAPYPETETDDFEADLQEIMSTPHSSASESRLIEIRPISSGANPFSSLAIIPSSQAPFSPPRDLLPPITFSSSSKDSHFVLLQQTLFKQGDHPPLNTKSLKNAPLPHPTSPSL